MDKNIERYVRELERTVQDLKQTNSRLKSIIEEYNTKEQSISKAIIASMEHASQLEASRKKLYSLDIQRSRLMYLKMEQVIKELYNKYPALEKETGLKEISERFRTMLYKDISEEENNSLANTKQQVMDDSIKTLLSNIVTCIETKRPETGNPPNKPTASSGFNYEEAMHPTMELEDIMKFFNLEKKNKKH